MQWRRCLPLGLVTLWAAGACAQIPQIQIPQIQTTRLQTTRSQSTQTLQSTRTHDASTLTHHPAAAPLTELRLRTSIRIASADPKERGELWLTVSAAPANSADTLTLRIPLSSNQDAYGESRACTPRPGGGFNLTFTAGLDERNFVPFTPTAKPAAIDLLLNKYLCRALAAPFSCMGKPVQLPSGWTGWRLGGTTALDLTAAHPASIDFTPIDLGVLPLPFDPRTCPAIAPSDGTCCVAGRETRWHCGGHPDGPGWHQVSGDCFHHETGNTCKD